MTHHLKPVYLGERTLNKLSGNYYCGQLQLMSGQESISELLNLITPSCVPGSIFLSELSGLIDSRGFAFARIGKQKGKLIEQGYIWKKRAVELVGLERIPARPFRSHGARALRQASSAHYSLAHRPLRGIMHAPYRCWANANPGDCTPPLYMIMCYTSGVGLLGANMDEVQLQADMSRLDTKPGAVLYPRTPTEGHSALLRSATQPALLPDLPTEPEPVPASARCNRTTLYSTASGCVTQETARS